MENEGEAANTASSMMIDDDRKEVNRRITINLWKSLL
jgi:hypothetical protein